MRPHQLTRLLAAVLAVATTACGAAAAPADPAPPAASAANAERARIPAPSLTPPAGRRIRVAFAVSEGSNVIDMAGPWEVFQDVHLAAEHGSMQQRMPFTLFTVAASREPIRLTGGLQVIPDHTFADAPQPDVVVVPAMRASPELHAWLRAVAPRVDVLMSVCTGAFQLAAVGLLDGKPATTHHDFWDAFASRHPRVLLRRGDRFVEAGERLATAGGLTSGIDLALRVVERYFGRQVARDTAAYMEYHSPYLD